MTRTGIVTATRLNFRSSPNGTIIKQLPKGTSVEIDEDQGEWLKVSVSGETGFVSAAFIQSQAASPPVESPSAGKPLFNGNSALAPDGTEFAKKYKLGVFNYGETSINQFIHDHSTNFATVPRSRLRIMQAVSVNEGKLEAINTWDNAFLTFGIFQWTVGADSGAGELPALVDHIKKKDASLFQRYFGQFGLDTVVTNSQPSILPTGFFLLNGTTLKSPAQKEQLRILEWAYRFWLAGRDDTVRQVQVEHAMERVDLFYRSSRHKIKDRFIADYITSEYGVALILDEHVNRPGHVPGTIAKAVDQLVAQIGIENPEIWTDVEEQRLLDIYIQLRAQTNMTDSIKRAESVRQAVAKGLISNRRGSYQT